MARKARHEADALIDDMSRLPLKKQPRWFKEMFKNWKPGVSTSDEYLNPDGLPETDETDPMLDKNNDVSDISDVVPYSSSDDGFDDTFDIDTNVDIELDDTFDIDTNVDIELDDTVDAEEVEGD